MDKKRTDRVQLTSNEVELMFYNHYNMAVKGVGET